MTDRHVHPHGQPGDSVTAPGPTIGFHAVAPGIGTYRAFLDLQTPPHGLCRGLHAAGEQMSFQVAILLYPGVTALDAAGPWEVLSRLPDTEVRFVGKEIGPVITEGGALLLGTTHSLAETPSPDLLLVPGGTTTPGQMVDDDVLDWLRTVNETTTWTTSVCTGSLILGAAGILKGLPATTHWYKLGVLKAMGAKPQPDQRFVRSGKVVTAAGVSAGIDLALWLAGEIAGRQRAEAIQLTIEYDPHPPFDAGHLSKHPHRCTSSPNSTWTKACHPTRNASSRRSPGDASSTWSAPGANAASLAKRPAIRPRNRGTSPVLPILPAVGTTDPQRLPGELQ